MKKLIILQGPPASGKSTWTKEYMVSHADSTVVVSRDAIRHSFGEYNMNHEAEVTALEESQTIDAMEQNKDIINDATNLNPKYLPKWEKLAEKYGYEIEYKKFYIPFKEAVKRDQNEDRLHKVGKSVIKRFYRSYYPAEYEAEMKKTVFHYRREQDVANPFAVICDLDGTLAWMQGRSPYDGTRVNEDLCDHQLATLLQKLMCGGVMVLFTSGREGTEDCRQKTLQWLKDNLDPELYMQNGKQMFELYMRKEKDYRGDEIVKREIYENDIMPHYQVICAFDDRNKVVNMWREIGLLCCQVNDGDF